MTESLDQISQNLGRSITTELNNIHQANAQIQADVTQMRADINQMRADITNLTQTQTQMRADVNNILQGQTRMQADIANLLQNQAQNQAVGLNRLQVCKMINKGVAKQNFENFEIERSKSFVWVQANLQDLRFLQVKLFFQKLIDSNQNRRRRLIRNPTRDEKRNMQLYFRYLDLFWDILSRFIRNNNNNYQAALAAANAVIIVQ